ncbi:CTL-like protein [Frankliniella fusca]|uniref:CTL-like protein n=1 Tax=Frankliniella fusca TaxID=407009 RepID=A0AAE1IXD3_9NEOP|nr:CTL-like protein [Frankliniella fusca]
MPGSVMPPDHVGRLAEWSNAYVHRSAVPGSTPGNSSSSKNENTSEKNEYYKGKEKAPGASNISARGPSFGAIDGVFHRAPVRPLPRAGQADDVLQHFRENPHTSQRRAAAALNMSKTTIQRILADDNGILNQALRVEDPPRRLEYCNWLVGQPEPEAFVGRVLWSDECNFDNKANVNRHNAHYWSDVNPHWMRTVNFQDQWSVNCWGGVLGENVIGPHFFDDFVVYATSTPPLHRDQRHYPRTIPYRDSGKSDCQLRLADGILEYGNGSPSMVYRSKEGVREGHITTVCGHGPSSVIPNHQNKLVVTTPKRLNDT